MHKTCPTDGIRHRWNVSNQLVRWDFILLHSKEILNIKNDFYKSSKSRVCNLKQTS